MIATRASLMVSRYHLFQHLSFGMSFVCIDTFSQSIYIFLGFRSTLVVGRYTLIYLLLPELLFFKQFPFQNDLHAI